MGLAPRRLVNLVEPNADVCLVSQACTALTDGRPLAEILLLDTREPHPERALTITSAGTLLAALALPAPIAPGHEEVVAHATWAKHVLDAAHARLDRWRYDSAPPAHGEPLVTVRIAIWGDVTPLLTVALPSVLNGSWPNVEVLVCSDGPQPHERAALEAHPDPRVRYLELPERPSYPDHPHRSSAARRDTKRPKSPVNTGVSDIVQLVRRVSTGAWVLDCVRACRRRGRVELGSARIR